jgi:dCTP deaminase
MALLSKKDIVREVKSGGLVFSPELDGFQCQPHSIDLRLGYTFYAAKTWEITQKGRTAVSVDYLNNIGNKNYFEVITLNPGQYFDILPGEYVIATTLESIHIKNLQLMGNIFARSSFNRRGLTVDISGVIDSGYSGNLMIPIRNNTSYQPIRLYPGERICQVTFSQLSSQLDLEDAALSASERSNVRGSTTFSDKERFEEERYILEGRIKDLKRDYNI